MSALSSLFAELQNARVIDVNPVEGVKRPQSITKRPRLGCTDKEVVLLVDFYKADTLVGLMRRAVMHFMFYTAVRVSELLNVRISDHYQIW
jgi:site-specific recombinase XerC